MVRPYWMETGRISPAGVPEKLGEGRWKATRKDRLRHARKEGDRRTMQEWLQQNLQRGSLSPAQKIAGARRII